MNVATRKSYSPPRLDERRPLNLALSAVLLTAAFIFGGASRQHAIALAVVELACIPLLVLVLSRPIGGGYGRKVLFPLALLAAAVIIPLLQLTPLPFSLWAAIPGREAAAEAAQLSGTASGWRTVTITPHETWKSVLALLPPATMFLATLRLKSGERQLLMGLVIAFALLNVIIGVGQVSTGALSPLYFYESVNRGSATGFFTNRNHYAILLVVTLPVVAYWVPTALSGHGGKPLMIAGVLSLVGILIVGIVMSGSRAGAALAVPAMLGAIVIFWQGQRAKLSKRIMLLLAGAIIVALAAALAVGLQPLLSRFATTATDMRFAAAPVILKESLAFLPIGSGVGSFQYVYQSFEPAELMGEQFLNHAHNDYLEIWLEAGVFGLVAVALFLAWWAKAALRGWRAPGRYGDLAQVAVVISALLLLHGLVDYPLRTPALATLFAFALGLLATSESASTRSARAASSERAA